MTDTKDILARSKMKVTSQFVQKADALVQEYKRQEDAARKIRDKRLEDFWAKFDALFSPGDRIKYFDGWDMVEETFLYHTEWHVYTESDNGLRHGLPIIIDTEWEKVA